MIDETKRLILWVEYITFLHITSKLLLYQYQYQYKYQKFISIYSKDSIMKNLMFGFVVLIFSINIFAATFSYVPVQAIKSSKLKALGQRAQTLQNSSTLNSSADESSAFLGTEGVVITLKAGQTETKMLRQLLYNHFSCNSDTTVSVKKAKAISFEGITSAFVGYEEESAEYRKRVENYRKDLIQTISAPQYDIFEVEYSGGGSCEFGIGGFLLLDRNSNEAVMVYNSWSA